MTELVTTHDSLDMRDTVSSYILETLLFTPVSYLRNNRGAVDIKVYRNGVSQPAMKIFRLFHECRQVSDVVDGEVEFAFQDEVNLLDDAGNMKSMERWQVNFSIVLDKETLTFKRIREKPVSVEKALTSTVVFADLCKVAGSTIWAGDWEFISDGVSWILQNKNETLPPVSVDQIKSLVPWVS